MGLRGGLIWCAHVTDTLCGGQWQPHVVRLAVHTQKERGKNQETFFCCFLVSIKLSICRFLLKVQCVKIQPVSRKGPWCVLKENRDIVQNVTAGFTYCSTGC